MGGCSWTLKHIPLSNCPLIDRVKTELLSYCPTRKAAGRCHTTSDTCPSTVTWGWWEPSCSGLRPHLPPEGTCTTLQIHTSRTRVGKAQWEKRFRVLLYKRKGSRKLRKLVLFFPFLQATANRAGIRPLKREATPAHPNKFQPFPSRRLK